MLKILFYITLFAATFAVSNENCAKWFTRLEKYVKIIPITKIGDQEFYYSEPGKFCYVPRDVRARNKIRDIAMEFYAISNYDAMYEVARCYEFEVEYVCIEDVQLTVTPNENCEKWISDLTGKIKLVPWENTFYKRAVDCRGVSYCGENIKVWYSQDSETNKKIAEMAKKYLKVSDDDARYEVTKCFVDAADFLCIKEIPLCEQWMNELEGLIKIVPRDYDYDKCVSHCHGQGNCRNPRHNEARNKIAEMAKENLEISDHDALNEVPKCYVDATDFVCIKETSICEKWMAQLEGEVKLVPRSHKNVDKAASYCLPHGFCRDTSHDEARNYIEEKAKKHLKISDHEARYEVTKCYADATYFVCIKKSPLCEELMNKLEDSITRVPRSYSVEEAVSYCIGKGSLWDVHQELGRIKIARRAWKILNLAHHEFGTAVYDVPHCLAYTTKFVCIKQTSTCEKLLAQLGGEIKMVPPPFSTDEAVSYCGIGQGILWSLYHEEGRKKITEVAKKNLEISDHDAEKEVTNCYTEATNLVCIKEPSFCEKWLAELEGVIQIVPRKYSYEEAISYCLGKGSLGNANAQDAREMFTKIAKKHLKISYAAAECEVANCYVEATKYVCIRLTTYEDCVKWFDKLENQIKIIPETYTDKEAFLYCRNHGRNYWYHRQHDENDQIAFAALSHLTDISYEEYEEIFRCYGDFSKHTCIEESCTKWKFEFKSRKQIFVIPQRCSINKCGSNSYATACRNCRGTQKCMNPNIPYTQRKIAEIAKKYLLRMTDDVVLSEVVKCFQDTNSFLCIEMNSEET